MSGGEDNKDDNSEHESKDILEQKHLKQMYNELAQEYNTLHKTLVDFKNSIQNEVICSVRDHNSVQNMQVVDSMCTLIEKMYEESDSDNDDNLTTTRLQELATATIELQEKQREFSTITTNLQSVQHNYQNMWKSVEELTEEKTKIREQLRQLKNDLLIQREEHETLQENVSKLRSTKKRYKKEIDQRKLSIDEQQAAYSHLQSQITLLQRQKGDLEECVRNLQQKSVCEMKTLLQAKKDVALESTRTPTTLVQEVEAKPETDEELFSPLSTDTGISNTVFEIDFILTEVHAQLMKILSISDMDTVHNVDFLEDIAVAL